MSVQFYEEARNEDLKYVIIATRYDGKWLLCRHKERTTWEFPGGQREAGETAHRAAARELWEETGALGFQLEPVAAYLYTPEGDMEGERGMGALYYADIWELGERPAAFEIEEICLLDALPGEMSYPSIYPSLMGRVEEWLAEGGFRSQMEDMLEMMI